ncbi:MAG TPA: phosphotransferase family protein [Acidimicrobiales bacterium]|nr:phosphotransferase family protein [Acidimicrobiales bacterium]
MTDTPWRRDPGAFHVRLQAWANAVVGDGVKVLEVDAPRGTGMSSETVLFGLAGADGGAARRYVARLAPDPAAYPVFPVYDLELQARCMRVVGAHTSIPVPEVPWYEPDAAWLGTPFLVMGRIDGVAPSDIPPYVLTGWVLDATAEQRARLQAGAIGVLARLHELTPTVADLSFLDRPEHGATPLAQHLGYQRWYYDWAREGVRYPLVERAFAWLDAHCPVPGPTVINWGDARIGNILFRDFTPVAVLDWEMAALGPVEVDVAWIIWMHRFFQNIATSQGLPGLPGFMRRADVVAAYERDSGRVLDDLHWYEVFAATRHAIITLRTHGRTLRFGATPMPDDPDDVVTFRPLLEGLLAGEETE